MTRIEEIHRIQSYLRENVRRNSVVVALPPFTLFFHPNDPLMYFNYAIPDAPVPGAPVEQQAALRPILDYVRAEFHRRERVARFEFFETFAPDLPAVLRANGFIEEGCQWGMVCTPATVRPVPDVPRLEITTLQPNSPETDLRDFLIAQRQGFNPVDVAEPSRADIQQIRDDLGLRGWNAFLGRLDGEPAGVSVFGRPLDGVSEVAGIATRLPFRRRGIAAQLTWQAIHAAFDLGVLTACLTAEDEHAGRVYERVGFSPFSIMLAYRDSLEVKAE
jgi:GNAT superfamily N-acetyltransferase